MKIELIHFENTFKLRKNKDDTGIISCKKGLMKLDEVALDQVIALNSSESIESATTQMLSVYNGDADVIKNDLIETLRKLKSYTIVHNKIII
mgnify:CR=1 FL=1